MTFYPVPTRRSSKAWPTRHRYIWVRPINDVYIASINLNVKLVILTKCFVNSPLIGFISMHVLLLNSYLLFLTYSVFIYKLISVLYRSMTEKYLKAPNIFTKLQKRPLSTMYNACSIQDDNHNNKFIFKHSLRVRIGRNTS